MTREQALVQRRRQTCATRMVRPYEGDDIIEFTHETNVKKKTTKRKKRRDVTQARLQDAIVGVASPWGRRSKSILEVGRHDGSECNGRCCTLPIRRTKAILETYSCMDKYNDDTLRDTSKHSWSPLARPWDPSAKLLSIRATNQAARILSTWRRKRLS